jgi:hypothetical protein
MDGGFCCDQTVIYYRSRDLMMWQLQYNYSSTTQNGSYRIAFAPLFVGRLRWVVLL